MTFSHGAPCRVDGASYYCNPERPVATPDEIAAAVHVTDERYQLAIVLAAWCHLRPQGDPRTATWRHRDLENARLTIERTLTACGSDMVLGPPKDGGGASGP